MTDVIKTDTLKLFGFSLGRSFSTTLDLYKVFSLSIKNKHFEQSAEGIDDENKTNLVRRRDNEYCALFTAVNASVWYMLSVLMPSISVTWSPTCIPPLCALPPGST